MTLGKEYVDWPCTVNSRLNLEGKRFTTTIYAHATQASDRCSPELADSDRKLDTSFALWLCKPEAFSDMLHFQVGVKVQPKQLHLLRGVRIY